MKKIVEKFNSIKNKQTIKAFSLIEIIVAVSIFSVIILSMTGIFKMVIDGQRRSIATQNVQESLKYFLEVINKEIRMAVRSDGGCNVSSGNIFYLQQGTEGDVLYFKNYYNQCVVYYLEVSPENSYGRFKISRNGLNDYISPSQISIDRLDFVLSSGYELQDLVTINIKAHSLGARNTDSEMILQTSLSSRYYKE